MAGDDAPLIVSVSGVRGIVGASLTTSVVADFAAAYGSTRSGKRVVVSRDGRSTGQMLAHAAMAGLQEVGCDVVYVGVTATPTCGYFAKSIGAAGAIQITASHNPPPWNGLKLFRPEGFVVGAAEGREIAERFASRQWRRAGWDGVGRVELEPDAFTPHLAKVLSLVDVAAIRARRFKIILDANHASGATFGPKLLDALGCQFEVLGSLPDGLFEHPPEPLAENLTGLQDAVRRMGADVGFAVDPDADRLALVDERGRYVGEECTLALAIRRRLTQQPGPVVINASTSRISEDTARAANCLVHRAKVGEVNVAERMIETGAVIGGEGNGGVIDPRVGFVRDSAIGMALVLEQLALGKSSLAREVDSLPSYVIRKEKYPVAAERLAGALADLKRQFADGAADEADGLRVDWPDAWVQVRASNTEPIVRVIAEARDADRAAWLCQQVGQWVK